MEQTSIAIDSLEYACRCAGGDGLHFDTRTTFADFTLEAWVRLDPPANGVTVYTQENFAGPGAVLAPGRYDDLSKRLKGPAATLFEHKDRSGRSWSFECGTDQELTAPFQMLDVPEGVALEFTAEYGIKIPYVKGVWDAPPYHSSHIRVAPLMQSILLPAGWVVYLFEEPGCMGVMRRLDSSTGKGLWRLYKSDEGVNSGLLRYRSMLVVDENAEHQEFAILTRCGVSRVFGLGRHTEISLEPEQICLPNLKCYAEPDFQGALVVDGPTEEIEAVGGADLLRTKSVEVPADARLRVTIARQYYFLIGPQRHMEWSVHIPRGLQVKVFEKPGCDSSGRAEVHDQSGDWKPPFAVFSAIVGRSPKPLARGGELAGKFTDNHAEAFENFGRYADASTVSVPGQILPGAGYEAVCFEKKNFEGKKWVVWPPIIGFDRPVQSFQWARRLIVVAIVSELQPMYFNWGEEEPPRAVLEISEIAPETNVSPAEPWFGPLGDQVKLTRGVWTHLALTRSGSTFTWYVNGKAIASRQSTLWPAHGPDSCVGRNFFGLIGPVRAWDAGRTAQEIASGLYLWQRPDQSADHTISGYIDPAKQNHFHMSGIGKSESHEVLLARTSFPKSVMTTSSTDALQHRNNERNEERKSKAVAASNERLHKARAKAMLLRQEQHNEAAARVAAGRLEAVWRLEDGQVANTDPAALIKTAPPALPPHLQAGEVTALCLDHATKTLFYATRDSTGGNNSIKSWGGSGENQGCSTGGFVQALAVDPSNSFVYWIEHPGKLRLCRGHGAAEDLCALPVGSDDLWAICVENLEIKDVKKCRLYWSNGREIWKADLSPKGEISNSALYVSHGRSLRPVALAVDNMFDETADPHRGKLFWADRDLGLIRSIDGSGRIRDLYEAQCAREALAIDVTLGRLYWNAEHRPLIETAVVDDPGLAYWFEDRGEATAHHQHIDVLRDLYESQVHYQSDPTLEAWMSSDEFKAAHPDQPALGKPRRNLVFTADTAARTDAARNPFVSIGPMYMDCSHGFSIEAVLKINDDKPWQRIIDFGNGADNLNIIFSRDSSGAGLALAVFTPGDRLADLKHVLVAPAVPSGKWVHVVATISSRHKGAIYVNGQKVSEAELPLPPTAARKTNYIGRGNASDAPFFNGSIAMLRVWNLSLTAEDIETSWATPFQELIDPDNPLEIFEEHLIHYDRSMIQHRDGRLWLMSGVVDGAWGAVPLAEMAVDGGLALQSAALEAHDKLFKLHYDRAKALAERDAALLAAKRKHDSDIRAGEQAAAKKRQEAAATVAAAKKQADTQRRDASLRRIAETNKQNQLLDSQKTKTKELKAQGAADAEAIKKEARDKKESRVADANHRLADARSERSKH